jgi:hypothetical protein
MVEDVVAGLHGLVDHLQSNLLAHAPKIDRRHEAVDLNDSAGDT